MSDPDIDRIVEQAIRNCTKVGDAASRPTMLDSRGVARRAAELAVAAERERCAKILDNKREAVPKPRSYESAHYCMGLEDGAAAIRAGKEVGSE